MESTSTQPYAGKRALDLLVAGTACAAFAPLIAGIAVATWLEDSGSPLFAQSRVGRRRAPFTILKLRSMREPLTQGDVERLGWQELPHDWRFAVNPGITGLSQLWAGPASRSTRRLDRLYLKRQSLLLDLHLIGLSFAVNVAGKRNVRRWLRDVRHPR